MLERLLERISVSEYQDKFILKGGLLIAAMVGLDSRTTMDMDATLKGLPLSEDIVRSALSEILAIDLNDNVAFELKQIAVIREDDVYGGYRASIEARFDTIRVALKIDLTTGDRITPREVSFRFSLMFEDRAIDIMAYNLETVLAEKYETILRRSTLSTRMRDFYDVYILINFQSQNIDKALLRTAIHATVDSRESAEIIAIVSVTLELLDDDSAMQNQWANYQKDFAYAKDISWKEIMDAVRMIAAIMDEES